MKTACLVAVMMLSTGAMGQSSTTAPEQTYSPDELKFCRWQIEHSLPTDPIYKHREPEAVEKALARAIYGRDRCLALVRLRATERDQIEAARVRQEAKRADEQATERSRLETARVQREAEEAEEQKRQREKAELQEKHLADPSWLRPALSALRCQQGLRRTGAIKEIKSEKHYAEFGGVQDLAKLHGLQEEIRAADSTIRGIDEMLKRIRRSPLPCADAKTAAMATCLMGENDSCGAEEMQQLLESCRP